MILCDAGPLVAMIDRDDPHHARCVAAMDEVDLLVSTWQCITEAMHLARRAGGYPGQAALWRLWERGLLSLHVSGDGELARMRELMHRYQDSPMDLADASLVTAAEWLNVRRVFTLDRHFRGYRLHDRHAFEIIPAAST